MWQNYPTMKNFDSSFKASLQIVKDRIDTFNVGALQLRESFGNHLTEVSPWVHSLNGYTYNSSLAVFIGILIQIGLLIAQAIPRFAHFRKYNFILWIISFVSLTLFCFSLHFQGNFASVNHDICLLFKQDVTPD